MLKGAPFEKRLVCRTYDGLAIKPLYGRAAARGAGRRTRRRARRGRSCSASIIPIRRPPTREALHDLENGATGLALVFAGSVGAYGYGLDASEATIARVLDGVHLDAGIAIDLDLSPQTKDAGRLIADLVKRRGIDAGGDRHPLRLRSDRRGRDGAAAARCPGTRWRRIFNAVIADLAAQGFRGPFAVADGRVIHNAGGSEAQELAYVLARRRRLSARARSRRHRARCRARHDLFPARRRRRPVPDHRQIPRAAKAVGAGRASLRACAEARRTSPPKPRGG